MKLLALVLGLAWVTPSLATQVVAATVEDLARASDSVLRGRV